MIIYRKRSSWVNEDQHCAGVVGRKGSPWEYKARSLQMHVNIHLAKEEQGRKFEKQKSSSDEVHVEDQRAKDLKFSSTSSVLDTVVCSTDKYFRKEGCDCIGNSTKCDGLSSEMGITTLQCSRKKLLPKANIGKIHEQPPTTTESEKAVRVNDTGNQAHSKEKEIAQPTKKDKLTPTSTIATAQSDKPQTTNSSSRVTVLTIANRIDFELQHSGLAFVTLLCYCMAHVTIYEIIYTLLLELTDTRVKNYWVLYSGIMLAGLLVLRSTGFLWLFLTGKRYRQSKAEMAQRLKQGAWDSKFFHWIEERTYLKTTLDIVGFYLCYISIQFFWSQFLSSFVDQREYIFSMLPSSQYHGQREMSHSLHGNISIDDKDTICGASLSTYLEEKDFEYIYKHVAKASYYQYSGHAEAPLYSASIAMLVYLSAACLSIFLLSKIGFAFEDNSDDCWSPSVKCFSSKSTKFSLFTC